HSRSLLKMIKNSEHGKYLASIGFADDLPVCAGVDTIPVLPQLVGNVIKVKRDSEKVEASKVPVMS
ncbi:MAG: 2-phosphosulfolactate phosphatase, partial [Bacteroidota bacterium]